MSETTKVEVLNTLGEVVIGFAELTFHNSSLITHNLVLDVDMQHIHDMLATATLFGISAAALR